MADYYKTDNRKLTFRECWNLTRSPLVLVLWFTKLFHIPLKLTSGLAYPESILDWEIQEEELSPVVRSPLAEPVADLLQLGFHSPFYYTMKDHLCPMDFGAVSVLHESQDAFAVVLHVRDRTVHPPKTTTVVVMVTLRADGTFLATTNRRAELDGVPDDETYRIVGASPEVLLDAHLQRIVETRDIDPIRQIRSVSEMIAAVGMNERREFDYYIERGFYAPMTDAEVATARAKYGKRPVPQARAAIACIAAEEEIEVDEDRIFWDDDDSRDDNSDGDAGGDPPVLVEDDEHDEVLAELSELQQGKSSWIAMIVVLAVSVLLFMGAGAVAWSWRFAALLLPILLFHEMGHFLAMWVFKYRNVKMFFIPFLGAAVSGQNYNVPGWKKTIVSLAGPVPGIFVGAGLGVTGLFLEHELLIEISLLALILNGFNLLPVIPLDGGWVMHAVLFSRHYIFDGAFRLVAIFMLGAGSLLLGTRFLFFIAIGNLFGLVAVFRLARVADRLKQQGISAASRDAQTIPDETARAIITEVKKSFPNGLANKVIAQHTLHVFESLNARPPGWLASFFLLGVYGCSFLVALVMSVVLVVGQQGQFGKVMEIAVMQPQNAIECGTIQQQVGPEHHDALEQYKTIIATFEDQETATKTFERLVANLPKGAAATLLGQTVLIELSPDDHAARKKWLAEMEQLADNVFVDSEQIGTTFRMTCIAPSAKEAKAIGEEIAEYFNLPAPMVLIPPWSPEDEPDDLPAEYRKARRTYFKLQQDYNRIYDDPRIASLNKKIFKAQRAADQVEVENLQKTLQELMTNSQKEFYEKIRDKDPTEMDLDVVNLHEKLKAVTEAEEFDEEAYHKMLLEMGAKMGQLPLEAGKVSDGGERFSANGSVESAALILNFNWLSFERPAIGASALIQWLCDQNCVDLKYEFQTLGDFDDFD